jgi:hypothetical protein
VRAEEEDLPAFGPRAHHEAKRRIHVPTRGTVENLSDRAGSRCSATIATSSSRIGTKRATKACSGGGRHERRAGGGQRGRTARASGARARASARRARALPVDGVWSPNERARHAKVRRTV